MNENTATYGIRSIRQMRVPPIPSAQNCRVKVKMVSTQEYFLREVDPLIGGCISHLLLSQPRDVGQAMLQYFQTLQKGEKIEPRKVAGKTKKEHKLYLATSIGPIVAKLVNRIALARPELVLDFICTELVVMMDEGFDLNEAKNPVPPTRPKSSASRAKFEEAKSYASQIDAGGSSPLGATPKFGSHSAKLAETAAISGSVAGEIISKALSPRNYSRPGSAPHTPSNKIALDTISHISSVAVSNVVSNSGPNTPKPKSEPIIMQIAVLGIGFAGKTSLINMLQGDFDSKLRPTNGFHPVTMMLGENTQVRFYDLGGGDKIRNIWDQYFHDAHAVMYVVDASCNNEEFEKSNNVFQATMHNALLNQKPLLVLANKQDASGARSAAEIEKLLQVHNHGGSKVIECCGLPPANYDHDLDPSEQTISPVDPRLEAGLEWLLSCIETNYAALNQRVVSDTQSKLKQEANKRIERERKVLKNKIACAFPSGIPEHLKPPNTPDHPEDVFTYEEGVTFLAAEIGEDVNGIAETAKQIVRHVGSQRLALQLIGALYAPISKKKTPMTWVEIFGLVLELRHELGLPDEQ